MPDKIFKLRALHITPDDKFFDIVFNAWENNEDFENKALFLSPSQDYKFRYIKSIEKLEIYYKAKDVVNRLQADNYDVVFLHSMPCKFYFMVNAIPKDRIVIWWGWGYDIYKMQGWVAPIIKLDLYKSITRGFIRKPRVRLSFLKGRILHFFRKPSIRDEQKKAIRRVDYYQPVVKLEFELMKQNTHFKAKEFYYRTNNISENIPFFKSSKGDILLGNSATPTNNHLDVLKKLFSYKQKNQRVIMPLSYGSKRYKDWLSEKLSYSDIHIIDDFLPRDQYFQIVDGCSYAVFGTIRQQAMGNIMYAIQRGIKVFLYKDSIAYKNLATLGFAVYAIEDINELSLKTPLTADKILQNEKAFKKEYERRMTVYHNAIKEISKRLHRK